MVKVILNWSVLLCADDVCDDVPVHVAFLVHLSARELFEEYLLVWQY